MEQYQYDFVEFLIQQDALRFGDFTLKSGRKSPYFFNAGQFNTARSLSLLGRFYATAIVKSGISFDVLFGPAYKGIPLVSSVAIGLYEKYEMDAPFCFNRKEAKAYGEGGSIIGSPLQGRVLIIDDVVSAGTTFRESANLIAQSDAKVIGIVTALDREERGQGDLSAVEEIKTNYQIETLNIIKLNHVIEYLKTKAEYSDVLQAIQGYQKEYGPRLGSEGL